MYFDEADAEIANIVTVKRSGTLLLSYAIRYTSHHIITILLNYKVTTSFNFHSNQRRCRVTVLFILVHHPRWFMPDIAQTCTTLAAALYLYESRMWAYANLSIAWTITLHDVAGCVRLSTQSEMSKPMSFHLLPSLTVWESRKSCHCSCPNPGKSRRGNKVFQGQADVGVVRWTIIIGTSIVKDGG